MFIDARIAVVFAAAAGPGDATLGRDSPAAAHPPGCACCLPRGKGALAFDQLFLDRVRGDVPWFTRVVVPQEDAAIRATVRDDPVVSARFRLA